MSRRLEKERECVKETGRERERVRVCEREREAFPKAKGNKTQLKF